MRTTRVPGRFQDKMKRRLNGRSKSKGSEEQEKARDGHLAENWTEVICLSVSLIFRLPSLLVRTECGSRRRKKFCNHSILPTSILTVKIDAEV